MSKETFICMRRSDVPNGTLQVLDLVPRSDTRVFPYTARDGQTKYVRRGTNSTVVTSGAGPIVTVGTLTGLGAYLIDNVESGGLGAGVLALTATQANTIATALQARVDAGSSMTLADVNATIQATVADTELTSAGGSLSTGSLEELLRICAGAPYTVPAGSEVETVGNVKSTVKGSFGTDYRETYETGAFTLSLVEGHLERMRNAAFEVGAGLAAGAAVVCYDASGNVLPRTNTQVGGYDVSGNIRRFSVTVDEADLTTAGNAHNIDVTGFPANVVVLGAVVDLNETFAAAAGVTEANLVVGSTATPNDTDELVETINLFGGTPGLQTTLSAALLPRFDAAYDLRITVSGAGAEDVTNFDTGNFTVHIFYVDMNHLP